MMPGRGIRGHCTMVFTVSSGPAVLVKLAISNDILFCRYNPVTLHPMNSTISSSGSSEGQSQIRLMTVDDHPIYRGGLAALIAAYPDFKLVAEAANGKQAVELYREIRPDVTLMDLSMPVMTGVEAITQITGEFPDARIIALTTWDGDADIHRALEAGARGYLFKDVVSDDVASAIRQVHAGARAIPGGVAKRLAEFTPRIDLTEREVEILGHMARGRTNAGIAAELFLSQKTVANHVSNIFSKLQVADRAEAIIRARDAGLR